MIENLRAVAWNGLEVGFQVLHRTYPSPGLESHERSAIQATIVGVGAVGMHAVQAASRYGDIKLWQTLAARGVPGVQVTAIDYDLTEQEELMKEILVSHRHPGGCHTTTGTEHRLSSQTNGSA